MAAGSVSIADNGTVTKTGAAGRLYDILSAPVLISLLAANPPVPLELQVRSLRGQAALANQLATWLVAELTGQTAARVTAGGLQKTPNPNDPDTATAAPASPQSVPLVHTT